MNIFVMRHGTTVWNELGIIQGRSNNRLSQSGKQQVEDVAQNFAGKVDVIICSPLMRTVQTANIMNKYLHVNVIKDERLTEIDQGIFTARCPSTFSEKEKLLKGERAKSAGMETYEECYNRAKKFVLELKNDTRHQNVLIVTHRCVAMFIEDILNGLDFKLPDFKSTNNFSNAEIKQFRI